MPLVEDDHVVETLTSNGADYPFDKWILPRGARCGKDLLDPETIDASIEVRSIDLISIPYQVPRRRVPWKSIDHLLRRPLSRRMFGDIEMNDTATVVAKDDEDEQNSEGCGRQSEKIERHQVLYMIIEKAPPSMGRWHAMANHILGDGGLGNGDAQLCQLAMHAGSSPERVGPAHIPYQLTYFGSDAWSSGPTPSALPSPISSEPTTVPADDRLRFHDDEDALPVSPDSAQQHPKHAVDIREPRPFHGTAEDGELLAKSDILESQLATSLEGRDESGNQRRNHAGMVLADRRLIKFGACG